MKTRIGLIFFFIMLTLKCFGLDIYVSSSYSDNPQSNNQKTLKGAYERIKAFFIYNENNKPWVVTQGVNIYILSDINSADVLSYPFGLIWDISGTSQYPITITSGINGSPQISRSANDTYKKWYILELKNVSYVTVSNLVFSEATVGIFINTSNYCTVQGCKFLYNTINFNCEEGGAGTITVTRETNSSDTTNLPKCNKILNNYIITNGSSTASGTIKTIQEGQIVCEPAWMYYQSIYLGNSKKTDIEYNTIINPSGVGISYNHGYAYNNFVSNNIVDACKDCDSYYLNNPINKAGICVLYDDCNSCGPTTVSGNINDHNYITFSEDINYSNNDIYYSPNYSHSFVIRNDLKNYNPNFSNNYYSFANTSSDMYTIDPYWIHYEANSVTNRIVTGDFDGDGQFDDIAALYDYGNNTSQIHLWLNKKSATKNDGYYERDKCFEYIGNVWQSSVFDATKVTSRFVSGDFNGDGKTDIAALYDYGSSTSKIIVWLSNGSTFNSSVWWSSSNGSYDANMVTGRFVSGDFNGDGKTDIAAMYNYGSSNARIHVWLSNGISFNSPVAWWISAAGSYDATKVSGRFVCGDFDGNGKKDIAAMYDYGTSGSAIHVWLSNGSNPFSQTTFWSTNGQNNYNANMTTDRFICGKFSSDNKDDIAAMYDCGSNNARINAWISSGSSFYTPETRWTSALNSYDPSKVSGRFLCGDFNNDGTKDIAAMFDYTFYSNFHRTRFHVWETSGSNFNIQNGLLGYPWMDYAANIGMNCSSVLGRNSNIVSISDLDLTSDILETSNNLNIYPNPANREITIETSKNNSDGTISICNLNGQELITKHYSESKLIIDISTLSKGIYFIKVVAHNGVRLRKFIVN